MITADRLREVLFYDPESGIFLWRVEPRRRPINGPAGSLNRGYRDICIDQQRYKAHRLAWLYMTGKMPTKAIDHIDGQPDNNRWSNLREASMSQNIANAKRRITNVSGYKGVSWVPQCSKWRVRVGGKHVGLFATVEEAGTAYAVAAQITYGDFARSA